MTTTKASAMRSYSPQRVHNDYVGFDVGLKGGWLLAVTTACCASGFLLVGYDNGVMGGLIETPAFKATFNNPDANTKGNIVSLYELGCFFGAIATFPVGERLGRRKMIFVGCIFMLAGAIIQAASSSVGVMIAGRIISGLGLGAINATIPVLQAETSPAVSRGQLVALDLTILNVGIVISYWIDYAFNFSGLSGSRTWRVPIALQCVFIVIAAIAALIIPDTPRWLAAQGRKADALAVLERLLDEPVSSAAVESAYGDIDYALQHERSVAAKTGWLSLIKPGEGWRDDALQSRKRLLLACFIQGAQQLGGINAIIYYSSTLFTESIRLDPQPAALLSGGLNMCLILGSVMSIFLVDRVGRKLLLLPCIAGMSLTMVVQTVLVKQLQDQENAGLPMSAIIGRAASAMLFVFELFFSLGFQATVWLIPSEILPLRIRAQGSALSTACNWICAFILIRVTPNALENIGYRYYIVFAVLNAAWLPIIAIWLPETKNKTLEQIDGLFAVDGWVLHSDQGRAISTSSTTTSADRQLRGSPGSPGEEEDRKPLDSATTP